MSTLHIRCGTDILAKLQAAGIPGQKLCFADPLCEGPLFPLKHRARSCRERARYLSRRYRDARPNVQHELERAERVLDGVAAYREIVLWFEADLYDQIILVYQLARLASKARKTRISLICIGSFPGVSRFIGLGQLDPDQLASLWPTRRPVTALQFRQALETWTALSAPSPVGLVRLSKKKSPLRFLPAALRRYLAEYPAIRNGLSQTAELALRTLRRNPAPAAELFLEQHRGERRPFLGDAMFFATLVELAGGRRPALLTERGIPLDLHDPEVSRTGLVLTEYGAELLSGKRDWLENGKVRWLGGVQVGPRTSWRYDRRRKTVVRSRSLP